MMNGTLYLIIFPRKLSTEYAFPKEVMSCLINDFVYTKPEIIKKTGTAMSIQNGKSSLSLSASSHAK